MKLSIIIINYNTEKFLVEALSSIYRNSYNKDEFEIIVVDNASTKGSLVASIKKYPAVKIIQNKKNIGFAAANNQAISQSNGEYILLLNPDTIIHKNTLNTVLNCLDHDKKVGIATCRVELKDNTLDDACHRGFPTPWNALCHFTGLAKLFPKSLFFNGYHLGYRNLNRMHEIDACSGAFMMVRRQAGERLKWFDDDYFWYGEDLDFCFRVKDQGWKIVFIPMVKITHYKGISSGIKKHSRHLSSADNGIRTLATRKRFEVMRLFYKKHYQNKYPKILTSLVMLTIKLKERLNLIKYNGEYIS